MMPRKGDIVWIDLGEVVGHEQANRRPCIIIKDYPLLKLSVVIPFTTSTSLSFYTIVKVEKHESGMTYDSYALCHQIRTISHERISGKAGALTDRAFNKIKTTLIDSLELM